MKLKTLDIECNECANKFVLKTHSKEAISFCPFCAEEIVVPEDLDSDEDDDYEDDVEDED